MGRTKSIRAAWLPLLLAVALATGCASTFTDGGMSGLTGEDSKSESEIRAAVHDKSTVTSLPQAGPDGL